MRMEEKTADFGRTLKIVYQTKHFGSERAVQLAAVLGYGADAIAVERPGLADMGKDLAGAADVAGFGIFQDQDEQVVEQPVLHAGEGGVTSLQLRPKRRTFGWKIGEPAAGQLRH